MSRSEDFLSLSCATGVNHPNWKVIKKIKRQLLIYTCSTYETFIFCIYVFTAIEIPKGMPCSMHSIVNKITLSISPFKLGLTSFCTILLLLSSFRFSSLSFMSAASISIVIVSRNKYLMTTRYSGDSIILTKIVGEWEHSTRLRKIF